MDLVEPAVAAATAALLGLCGSGCKGVNENGLRLGGWNTKGVRAKLLWEPTEAFSVTATAYALRNEVGYFSYFTLGGEPQDTIRKLEITLPQLKAFKDAIVEFWLAIRALQAGGIWLMSRALPNSSFDGVRHGAPRWGG